MPIVSAVPANLVYAAPIIGDMLYNDSAIALLHRSNGAKKVPQSVKFMYLHAGGIRFTVRILFTLLFHFSSFLLQRYWRTNPQKQFHFEIRAPIPEYWADFCNKLGISLDSDILEGGVWIDGKRALDENIPDLEGRWVW